jgi:predicted acylesterase/phospholipase RssA
MLDVVMRSTVLGSAGRIRTIKNDADYYFNPPVNEFGLLAFDQLDKIADAGYLYAGEKIRKLKEHHQHFPFG